MFMTYKTLYAILQWILVNVIKPKAKYGIGASVVSLYSPQNHYRNNCFVFFEDMSSHKISGTCIKCRYCCSHFQS